MKQLIIILTAAVLSLNCSAQTTDSIPSQGYAVMEAGGDFHKYEFNRHPLGDDELLIDIEYSAISHTDIHRVRGDWGAARFTIVAGHEIVGKVVRIGKNVTRFKVGDHAGVGALLNSCGECEYLQGRRGNLLSEESVLFRQYRPFPRKLIHQGRLFLQHGCR